MRALRLLVHARRSASAFGEVLGVRRDAHTRGGGCHRSQRSAETRSADSATAARNTRTARESHPGRRGAELPVAGAGSPGFGRSGASAASAAPALAVAACLSCHQQRAWNGGGHTRFLCSVRNFRSTRVGASACQGRAPESAFVSGRHFPSARCDSRLQSDRLHAGAAHARWGLGVGERGHVELLGGRLDGLVARPARSGLHPCRCGGCHHFVRVVAGVSRQTRATAWRPRPFDRGPVVQLVVLVRLRGDCGPGLRRLPPRRERVALALLCRRQRDWHAAPSGIRFTVVHCISGGRPPWTVDARELSLSCYVLPSFPEGAEEPVGVIMPSEAEVTPFDERTPQSRTNHSSKAPVFFRFRLWDIVSSRVAREYRTNTLPHRASGNITESILSHISHSQVQHHVYAFDLRPTRSIARPVCGSACLDRL